ncbi:Serine--pyruvate aminotransferase [Frankliniella fusca]|uniref:Serine--pyruvate aminotransferase n=1 Tax=Frankliniella fusca TaxID=407009 RepID=A0AAE1HBZ1_9NEOP|nr:Serine--pyruvate aminotransferase [Frankliniella fusca]
MPRGLNHVIDPCYVDTQVVKLIYGGSPKSYQVPPEKDVIVLSSDSESEINLSHPIKIEKTEPFKLVQYDSSSFEESEFIVPAKERTVNVTLRKRKASPSLSSSNKEGLVATFLSAVRTVRQNLDLRTNPQHLHRSIMSQNVHVNLLPKGKAHSRIMEGSILSAPEVENWGVVTTGSPRVNNITSFDKDQMLNDNEYVFSDLCSNDVSNSNTATAAPEECILCQTNGPPVEGGHTCFYCGIPVHAFGCSVQREGGSEGYGGTDKMCLKCAKEGSHIRQSVLLRTSFTVLLRTTSTVLFRTLVLLVWASFPAGDKADQQGQPGEQFHVYEADQWEQQGELLLDEAEQEEREQEREQHLEEDPILNEVLADLHNMGGTERHGRPVRARRYPVRIRTSYLIDETP